MSTTPRDFVGYGEHYPQIGWPNGARIAVSMVVNFEEGSERTPLNDDPVAESKGEAFQVPPGQRNLVQESYFDYGSRVGFWRLLDIMDRYEVKATFFCCGMALEMNPEAAREITARGHEPASHGYRWGGRSFETLDDERQEIRRAVQAIEETTGQRPLGWFGVSSTGDTRRLLAEEGGFVYDCDSYAEDLPYFVEVKGKKWLVIPYGLITNDGFFRYSPGYSEPDDFFHQLKEAFDCLYAEGASHPQMMSVGLHMRVSGRPGRANAVEDFLRYAKSFPDVWFARRIDIARWWLEHYGHLPALPMPASSTP